MHTAAHPLHVTLRARGEGGSLRQAHLFACIKISIAAAQRPFFRVLHYSVQGDHVHLVVEADSKGDLSRGMRGLSIRIALSVNRCLGRRGAFWADRYHARALRSPREVRNVLVYVLFNHRHHGRTGAQDSRSSAAWFDGFRSPPSTAPPPDPPVRSPRTWLAAQGWKRLGLIDMSESPARAAPQARAALPTRGRTAPATRRSGQPAPRRGGPTAL